MFSPEVLKSMTSSASAADMKLMCQQMAQMSDEDLARYSAQFGTPSMSPQAMRAAAASMANLNTETMEQVKQQATQKLTEPSLPQSRIKDEGNKLFSAGEYRQAIEKYQQAISQLASAALSPDVIKLEVTCRLNIANCSAKVGDFERVVEESRKALLFGDNAKANYRMAQGLYKTGRAEEAWDYVTKAYKSSSNDAAIKSLYDEIKETTQKSEELEREPPKPTEVDAVLPKISKEQMDEGMSKLQSLSPENRKQYFEMFQNTDPRLLAEVFKSQGLEVKPEDICKMRESFTEESFSQLTNMLGDSKASKTDQLQAAASNPAMRKVISEMLSFQTGRPAQELERYINILQSVVGAYLSVKRYFDIVAGGRRKYVWLGGLVVLIAYIWS